MCDKESCCTTQKQLIEKDKPCNKTVKTDKQKRSESSCCSSVNAADPVCLSSSELATSSISNACSSDAVIKKRKVSCCSDSKPLSYAIVEAPACCSPSGCCSMSSQHKPCDLPYAMVESSNSSCIIGQEPLSARMANCAVEEGRVTQNGNEGCCNAQAQPPDPSKKQSSNSPCCGISLAGNTPACRKDDCDLLDSESSQKLEISKMACQAEPFPSLEDDEDDESKLTPCIVP